MIDTTIIEGKKEEIEKTYTLSTFPKLTLGIMVDTLDIFLKLEKECVYFQGTAIWNSNVDRYCKDEQCKIYNKPITVEIKNRIYENK